jgi:hypothetical protein
MLTLKQVKHLGNFQKLITMPYAVTESQPTRIHPTGCICNNHKPLLYHGLDQKFIVYG